MLEGYTSMDNNWNNWNNFKGPDAETAAQPEVQEVAQAAAQPEVQERVLTNDLNAPSISESEELFESNPDTSSISDSEELFESDPDAPMPMEEPTYESKSTEIVDWRNIESPRDPYSSYYNNAQGGSKSSYVTKKVLAIALILTMLATSALTVGGLALSGVFNKRISAYNNNILTPASTTSTESSTALLSLQEIAAANENAVVEIQTESLVTDYWIQNYVTQGAGSGVLIDSDGYILTCYHVIKDARSIKVTTKNGAHYDATVVGYDDLTDLAVIKIKGSNFKTVTYGDSSSLSAGDVAVVMGNPLGQLGGSISTGIISALDRSVVVEGKAMTLIQTDAAINPGNSGGGLFDGTGKLIGIVVAKAGDSSSRVEGIGFAIPINQAAVIADQIIEHGKVPRPLIGVMIVDVTNETDAARFGLSEVGLYIDSVNGENAIAAGFQKGDIIKAVNGSAIRNRYDLTVELSKHKAGDKVTVVVSRNGEMIEIETVLHDGDL